MAGERGHCQGDAPNGGFLTRPVDVGGAARGMGAKSPALVSSPPRARQNSMTYHPAAHHGVHPFAGPEPRFPAPLPDAHTRRLREPCRATDDDRGGVEQIQAPASTSNLFASSRFLLRATFVRSGVVTLVEITGTPTVDQFRISKSTGSGRELGYTGCIPVLRCLQPVQSQRKSEHF